MSDVKFLDLKSQYLSIKDEVNAAVLDVLDSTAYVLGPRVQSFEKAFAEAHCATHGVAVNTGTSALHVALLAEGIGTGDEVITIPMTFTATVAAISYTGATPVFGCGSRDIHDGSNADCSQDHAADSCDHACSSIWSSR